MKFFARVIMAFIDVIRPMLGQSGCCIYPVTCRQFAQNQLITQPLYKAVPRIILRVLSCNPITRIFRIK